MQYKRFIQALVRLLTVVRSVASPKRVLPALLAVLTVAGLVTVAVPAPQAGAVTNTAYTNDINTAIWYTVVTQQAAGTPLTSTQPTCLTNEATPVKIYSNGWTNANIVPQLEQFFNQLIQPGYPCDSGWDQSTDPDAAAANYTIPSGTAGAAPLATAASNCNPCGYAQATQYPYDPSTGTGGPYNFWWNINGHTSSAWLFTQWFGYGTYSFQGPNTSPQCSPGSTAPGYSVSINFCTAVRNGAQYYSVDRINFTVTFSISIFGIGYTISDVHQYWVDEWINGYYNTGCSIGC